MKVACLQENLNRGLSIVGRAIPSGKASNPVIQRVLLTTEDNQIRLTGTDLMTEISVWLDSQISEPGQALIPHKHLANMVGSFARERVEIESDSRSVIFKCGTSNAKLQTTDSSMYPLTGTEPEGVSIIMGNADLKAGLAILFAAANDSSRPTLQGARFGLDGDTLTLEATNGYCMAMRTLKVSSSSRSSVIVPKSALSIVQQLLSDAEGVTVVSISQARVTFQLPSVQISVSLIPGTFPNCKEVIPSNHPCLVTINRQELMRAVRSALVISHELKVIRVIAREEELALASSTQEIGEYNSTLSADVVGESKVAFNGDHLVDALQSMTSEKVSLEMKDKTDPVAIREGSDYVVVVMPMITSEW